MFLVSFEVVLVPWDVPHEAPSIEWELPKVTIVLPEVAISILRKWFLNRKYLQASSRAVCALGKREHSGLDSSH